MKDIKNYNKDVQNLIQIIDANRGIDPKIVIDSCDELEKIAMNMEDRLLVGYARFAKGETFYLLSDVLNFYREMTSAIPLMERTHEWEYVVKANNMLGIMSLNRGNAPYAMDYYLNALSLCQKHKLSELEWIVNMNMGALYLNIEEYEKALNHIELAYAYIVGHKGDDDNNEEYFHSLTNIYINMGKVYLSMSDVDKAAELMDRLDYECAEYLDEMEKIVINCFKARLMQKQGDYRKCNAVIREMNRVIDTHIPLMDFFDDIYEYLLMLLEIEHYDDFFIVMDVIEQIVKTSAIKNLERKLLSLKIKYYRKTNKSAEYMRSAVLYYELTEYMEQENHNMVISMIDLRNSFDSLTAVTKEVKKQNKALQKKSETDAVTKLPNRFALRAYADKSFAKAMENGTSFAVEMLDIDYFKQYNDNYGHQMGDTCIKSVAKAIASLREPNKVFCTRYGGDEFVIIYEGYDKDEVESLANKLKKLVEDEAIEHKYSEAADIVTLSQGICIGTPTKGDKVEDYLHKADDYLYKAKEVSRNTVYVDVYNTED